MQSVFWLDPERSLGLEISGFHPARSSAQVTAIVFTVSFIIVPELVSQRLYSPHYLHAYEPRETYFPPALSSANNHLFSAPSYCVDSGRGEKRRGEWESESVEPGEPSRASRSHDSASIGSGVKVTI